MRGLLRDAVTMFVGAVVGALGARLADELWPVREEKDDDLLNRVRTTYESKR